MDSSTPSIAPELDSRQRSRLIRQLSYTLDIHHVDSITHSLFWLADIKALEKLLTRARSPESPPHLFLCLTSTETAGKTLKDWLGRPEIIPDVIDPISDPNCDSFSDLASDPELPQDAAPPEPSSPPEGPEKRSKYAEDVARARDQERCPIVKMGEPIEVAHIYPFTMQKQPRQERTLFRNTLGMFWSSETIAKWQQHIVGPDGTEVPSNLLYLWKSVHGLWREARFALEPIEMFKDKRSLEMRFWWLPKRDFAKSVRLSARPSLPSNLDEGPFNVKLWDSDTEKRIRSGHTVTMTTPDPESMPLPAFELLHMQWILNRVAAMSGAPDALESDEEDEEEFEYYGGTWVR